MGIPKYLLFLIVTLNLFSNENSQITKFERLYSTDGNRFTKDAKGVITDNQTNLEWIEGPDKPTSWLMADLWIESLKGTWRLPTTKELSQLYIKDSERKGKYGDPLCRDYVFTRNSGYSLWSIRRSDNSAYMYDFSRGYYHWTEIVVKGYFDRAIAVRDSVR